MVRLKNLGALLIPSGSAVALAGCAVGPYEKLDRAQWYLSAGRTIPAEPLIVEAMADYEKENNQLGIGLARQDYGILLQSPTLQVHNYAKYGFRDKSVTVDNHLAKSTEYLDLSLENFRLAAEQGLAKDNYALLYAPYFNMAVSYHYLKDPAHACEWTSKSMAAADENDRRTPKAKVPREHRDKMDAMLKDDACPADSAEVAGR